MRKSLTLALLLGLPALAQITGGHETVQDAIRFERQKDAADARQARIEAQRASNSSADRESDEGSKVRKTSRARKGSAARSQNTAQPQK